MHHHYTYEDMLTHVSENGIYTADRTGTGTFSTFGMQARFDLSKGFPLVTTKKVPFKLVLAELLWILSGSTNNKDLQAMGCTIWDEWATEGGALGPIYGQQWRSWECEDGGVVDQISRLVDGLNKRPFSRRHVVSTWNVAHLPDESVSPQQNVEEGRMALAPCHALFQFHVQPMSVQQRLNILFREQASFITAHVGAGDTSRIEDSMDSLGIPRNRLSCQLYQRSADLFLGVPFNIASYALLTHMIARHVGMEPGDFIWTGGDCHIYSNHLEQVDEQLKRKPYALPKLKITGKPGSLFGYTMDDFELVGYEHHPAIKAPVAI